MNYGPEHMTAWNSWTRAYFLGIGGIGMSALARMLKRWGIDVSGYDRTQSQLTSELISEGIPVHFDDNIELIPFIPDIVVYTPAIPKDNKEFIYLAGSSIPMVKRAELLGIITKDKRLITIGGTHGKTSVSCWIAHILNQSPDQCNAILGGISKNLQSNLVFAPATDLFVTEADEFDHSFLQLQPWIALITSVDADHLDIYGDHENLKKSFTAFTSRIRPGGKLIIKKGIDLVPDINNMVGIYTYSIKEKADFQAINISLRERVYHFDLITPFGRIKDIRTGIPGLMNLENAVAAAATAILAGAGKQNIIRGISSFLGVRRRFDHRIVHKDFIYIDDYAHHPEEINACIDSVRKLYTGRKITGVFQPHLYTRTRDFAREFAVSLQALDKVVLLDIYPARELPIEGVSSEMLFEMIDHPMKFLCTREKLIDLLIQLQPEILLTLGAGDIDRLVAPIETTFKVIHQ